MEPLDLKYLQYAVAVARYGSVTRAAKELYLAQPNLSRAITELEQSLGFQLFIRSRRGMSLTPQGEKYLTEAGRMLDRLAALAQEYRNEKIHRIHFSCVPSSLFVNTILEVARQLPNQLPGHVIQCQEYERCTELFENVEKDRSLAAFLTLGTEMKEALIAYLNRRKLAYHSLSQSPAYGVVHSSSPLYHPETIPPSIQYEGASLMLSSSYFEPIGISFRAEDFPLPPASNICHGSGRAANLDRLESQEDLIMLSCHVHSKVSARNDLIVVPWKPDIYAYEYGYVTRADRNLEPEEQLLLSKIEEEVKLELAIAVDDFTSCSEKTSSGSIASSSSAEATICPSPSPT